MAFSPVAIVDNIERVIVGKRLAVSQTAAALVAGGHILIEDVPGTGKTVLAKSLARSIAADFKRVQFTPDLLPSDITGVSIYNQKSGEFEFRAGPVFTNVLLADELNRATPRTQSALLESMEERQVTADGAARPLPDPFFVIATQNPIEQEGVYRLPEAQLDRFLMKISLGYPDPQEEARIVEDQRQAHPLESLAAVATAADVLEARRAAREIHVAPPVLDYMTQIVRATRRHKDALLGASPRASLALYRASQAMALLLGKKFVIPDVVKGLAPAILRHRLLLQPQALISGRTPDLIIREILEKIEVPVCDYATG
ncbi:MAG: MoxR family ATPase [Candidatus Sumerlaeota bacterium]|nr:MoxR family ATPase [Candidatus Sumerlaeota bacterium]